ncbi:MAG: PGPGW domain-containing protein [Desulfotignum sp.]|nr:PGPGW domain-containing protein [Desulfotignum sp.]
MNTVLDMARQYQEILALLTIVSAAGFVFGLLAVSRLVCWLPASYFMGYGTPGPAPKLLRRRVRVVKNLAGLVLVFLGFIMLFVPGQGLLTLFLGIVVMDFPGKKKLIIWLIRMRQIQTSLNWIRKKKGRPPFVFPNWSTKFNKSR